MARKMKKPAARKSAKRRPNPKKVSKPKKDNQPSIGSMTFSQLMTHLYSWTTYEVPASYMGPANTLRIPPGCRPIIPSDISVDRITLEARGRIAYGSAKGFIIDPECPDQICGMDLEFECNVAEDYDGDDLEESIQNYFCLQALHEGIFMELPGAIVRIEVGN